MKQYSRHIFISVFMLSCLLHRCTPNPFATTNRQHKKQTKTLMKSIRGLPGIIENDALPDANWRVGTTNFNLRKPNFVIIHHTAQNSCLQTLRTFTLPRTQVSAHYVICKDGSTYHMLNDYLRAWHGGMSRWGSVTDINSFSWVSSSIITDLNLLRSNRSAACCSCWIHSKQGIPFRRLIL